MPFPSITKEKTSLKLKKEMLKLALKLSMPSSSNSEEVTELRKLLAENPNYMLENDPEFAKIAQPILEHKELQRRKEFEHHKDLSDYDHMLQVASLAYLMAKELKLDYNQVVTGALLHDFYYEDWRAICYDDKLPDKHGPAHPIWALENATFNFPHLVNSKVASIIADHMLVIDIIPLKFITGFQNKFPRNKEAWVVAISDMISSMTKAPGKENQIDAKTMGIPDAKVKVVHRVVNPLRTDFEIKFGESVLNDPKEPHLKDRELVEDFALKSKAWHINSMDLDHINQQFGYFFLHQKYLLDERYEMARRHKMNDTLDPLLELKDYYQMTVDFVYGKTQISGVEFRNLDSATQKIIISTLASAKVYLNTLAGKLEIELENRQENLNLHEHPSGPRF